MSSLIDPIEFSSAVKRYSRAVARLTIRDNEGATLGFGTGFLVTPSILVTCNHLVPTATDAMFVEVNFDFHRSDNGRVSHPYSLRLRPNELFITHEESDLTIVSVAADGKLSDREIPLGSSREPITVGESMLVLHHGSAEPLKISFGEVCSVTDVHTFQHSAATDTGSSGAPVFDHQWNLIGVHHAEIISKKINSPNHVIIGEAVGYPLLLPLLERNSSEDISDEFSKLLDLEFGGRKAPTKALKEEIIARDSVFVSYAHADQEHDKWKERLLRQLDSIPSIANAKIWDDSRIEAGDNWLEEIEFALKRTRLAILLIGPHFLTSKFVLTKELPKILEATEKEGARVLPLITNYAAYKRSALGGFQSFNDPDNPLESLERSEQNRLILAMAEKVADLLENHNK